MAVELKEIYAAVQNQTELIEGAKSAAEAADQTSRDTQKVMVDLQIAVATINQRCADRGKMIEEHHESLYSDEKGLKDRVKDLEDARASGERAVSFWTPVLQGVLRWAIIFALCSVFATVAWVKMRGG